MNTLSNWKQYIPTGERLYSWLAVVAMLVVGLGLFVFARAFVVPQLQAREKLASELASAEQKLVEVRKTQEKSPDQLRVQLATAQATLKEAGDFFLTDSQAAEALDSLSGYAAQTGVSIVSVQAQPSPQQGKTAYEARMFRLQAEGDAANLAHFVALIKEAALPGYVLSNVSITDGGKSRRLGMDITLYTSPFASAAIGTAVPLTPSAPAGSQPAATPTPTLTALQVLLQRLDVAWAAGDWVTAISVIDQIRAVDPQNADMPQKLYVALVNYGRQLAAGGRLEEAKAAFGRALVINPNGSEAAEGLLALAGGSPTSTPTPQSLQTVYVVRPGDTLFSIARRYGVTVQAVMSANGLTGTNIRAGQQLVIPAR